MPANARSVHLGTDLTRFRCSVLLFLLQYENIAVCFHLQIHLRRQRTDGDEAKERKDRDSEAGHQ